MLDKSSVPERETTQSSSQQPKHQQQQCPPGWAELQESLASAAGLSILLVEGHQPPAVHVSNNNSICRAFQSSDTRRRLCDPYCGVAYERAMSAGAASYYRCHAGLHCFAMPVELGEGRRLAVIGGRAFLTTADYRLLAERLRTGDLQDLLSSDLFKNVIFAARQDLDDLAKKIAQAAGEYLTQERSIADTQTALDTGSTATTTETTTQDVPERATDVVAEAKEERPQATGEESHIPTDSAFHEACGNALRAFSEKHGLTSIALLLRDRNTLTSSFATGLFKGEAIRVELGPKDSRLALAARAGTSIVLGETASGFKPVRASAKQEKADSKKTVELFPLVVGEELKGALLVRDSALDEATRREIIKFCRDIALPIEVSRLRSELEQRARFADQLVRFTEQVNALTPAESYLSILRHSAELLHAERGSLLLFDADSNELAMKATMGFIAGQPDDVRLRLGDGISGTVLQNGQPLVVRDLEQSGHTPAPAERRYKTKSFISYPITIGGRKVGVLNVTDKAGGGSYDEIDLSLLETIAPQMALALDRAEWHEKAEQFQLMSITDPLTGLLNRRYMEERLDEELKRSSRHGYAMSFMMIDIDDFKIYNDKNLHQAGDLALEMTAQCLKSALRSADVASRYGGEEFSILLPQTTLDEACAIAERIRRRVQRTRFPHGKTQPLGAVTISIGVSTFTPTLHTPAAIIGAADRALYSAKSLGKNQVFAYQEPAA
ncbi:MAG TPA: diguanylate cyclase [Pyrinomonadaceae bacterium]|nr:diguanylate cyclase [Pyrinomonadaceae bacterium]